MSETLNSKSPERAQNPEVDLNTAKEQHERIQEQLERRAEKSETADVEKAKAEALDSARKAEKLDESETTEAQIAEKPKKAPKRNKKNLDISFNKQMSDVRHEMSAPSRTFSKIIHNKAVEKLSDGIGSTVARPNAILSGSVTAFVLVLSVYLLARYIGYPLSGFEVIGSFFLGWLLGIIFDFLRIMITGKR